MGKAFLICSLVILSACNILDVARYEGEYLGNAVNDYARVQSNAFHNSTTFEETYEALKTGIKDDTLPARKIIAEVVFPEITEDFENDEINYHYDDRRVLQESIHPAEKPDPYVLAEEKRFENAFRAKQAEKHRQEKLRAAAVVRKNQVYCYKTLADATCYKEPLEGQEFRLIK